MANNNPFGMPYPGRLADQSETPMKYYLYVSRSKVEMLFGQTEESSSKTVNWKQSIGISSMGVERQTQNTSALTLYNKLDKVISKLSEDPGIFLLNADAIASGPEYCQDTDQWNTSILTRSKGGKPDSYCLYKDQGEIITLLIGSPANLTGQSAPTEEWLISPSWSVDEFISDLIERYTVTAPDSKDAITNQIDHGIAGILGFCGSVCAYFSRKAVTVLFRVSHTHEITDQVWDDLEGAYGNSIFVGKPRTLVIGSPLYVALESESHAMIVHKED